MKKILFSLMALMAILPASADRYFTLRYDSITAINDTLSFYPDFNSNFMYQMYMTAHLDGYTNNWYLKMIHPDNVTIDTNNGHQVVLGPAMSVPYINSQGDSLNYEATLLTNLINQPERDSQKSSHFASQIDIMGYWYPSNQSPLECYGEVKWPDGDYDYLFSFWLNIPYGTINFTVTFDLTFNSSRDSRDILCLNNHSVRNLYIHAGYKPGDINGDGLLTMGDVVFVQDLVLYGNSSVNPYELDAADVDRDGAVTISDVSELIDLVLLQDD